MRHPDGIVRIGGAGVSAQELDRIAMLVDGVATDENGAVVGESRFLGLYTASAYLARVDEIQRMFLAGQHDLAPWADDGEEVPSLVPVYPSADFHEREGWDMFGIVFADHPNLRRILMPPDWAGHPQRKDYPVGGEPVQFSEAR